MTSWNEDRPNSAISWTKRPQSLSTVIDRLEQEHATDTVLGRVLARLYWNRPLSTRTLPTASVDLDLERYAAAANRVANQLGFNLLRELVDAMAARVCRQMACQVITVGGDSALSHQAAHMSRLIDGLNTENDLRSLGERVFIDACTAKGFGALKVGFNPASNEITVERCDPFSVFFSYSAPDKPQCLFYRPTVLREYVQDMYPRKADAISRVKTDRRPIIAGVEPAGESAEDTVVINEAWKIATGDKPGMYVKTCGQVVLECCPYPHDFHQLVLFRVLPEFTGPGGVAVSRIGAPYHRWLNQLVRVAYDSFRGNVPRVVKHAGTTINQGGVSDIPFSELEWEGVEKPEITPGNVVSEQVLNFIPTLQQQARAVTGVNQAMSAGLKPAGINSAPALREYVDFADSRLNGPNERWAHLWSDVGRAYIGVGSEHYKSTSVLVQAPGASSLSEIHWKDVDLRKSKFRLKFTVTSGLSSTVPGKMQDVGDLMDWGLADPIDGLWMLKDTLPDIAAIADRLTGPRRRAMQLIERALDGIIEQPPLMGGPDMLKFIILAGSQMWCKAEYDGNRTPEQFECLRKLIRAAMRKLKPATALPIPQVTPVQSAPGMSPDAVRGVGVQGAPQTGPVVAHDQYEAASLGIGQAPQP